MMTSDERLIAPWTTDQVESLNAYQKDVPAGNRYLCEFKSSSHKPLLATGAFWECPDCHYRGYWAYSIALDWSWRKRINVSTKPVYGWRYT